jgi:hypothetical protein
MHNLREFAAGARSQQLTNASAIELGMDVINPNLRFCEDARRKREKRRRAYEFAPRQHVGSLVEQVKSQPGKLPRLWRLVHRLGLAPVRADYRDRKIGSRARDA